MINFVKKIFLTTILLLLVAIIFAQTGAKIDERLELTTVVFRLTGVDCFTNATESNYIADVDSYFSKYANHELIKYVKSVMKSRNILNLYLPVDLAGDIEITKKGITLNDEWNLSCDGPDTSAGSWTKQEIEKYVRLLDKFYKETRFHSFFVGHSDYYAKVETRANELVFQIDTVWFQDFFGQRFSMSNIWIVPLLGPHNFMDRRTGENGEVYRNCAIGFTQIDSLGYPLFDYRNFMVLIHEICHNYNNPICEKYEKEFLQVCDTLFSYVGKDLSYEHYGNRTSILYEGLNRVCEYSYYMDHHTLSYQELDRRIRLEEITGFVWLHEMLQYMEVFRSNRDLFPTYEDFVPQLRLFLEQVAEQMESYYLPKMQMMSPMVVATFPANNALVDTTITSVEIIFSKPMQEYIWVSVVDSSYQALPLPVDFDNIYWLNDHHYVMPLTEPLKPNTQYGFRARRCPDSTYGFPTIPYDLIFKTK